MLQLITWSALFVGALSIGVGLVALMRKLTGDARVFLPDPFGVAWLGIAAVIGFLELASLFIRVGPACIVLLGLATLPGLPLTARWLLRCIRRSLRRSAVATALVAVWVVGVSLVVLQAANEAVVHGDTLTTHIQQMMWARDYGAVIGLGNLNPKLAFDQSIHLLAALLDHGPFRDRSVRLTVPFFLWITLLQWLIAICRRSRNLGDMRAKCFCGLTLPFLVIKTQSSEVSSLASDLPMACVALSTMLAVVRLPAAASIRQLRLLFRRHVYECVVIGALGALLLTIKFSGAVISLFAIGLSAFGAILVGRRWLLIASVVPVLLGVGMLGRRLILCGWLLYPIPFGNLHLPWSIAEADVVAQYRWIKSWARSPDQLPAEVLDHGFFHWFAPWFAKFRTTPEMTLFVLGFALLTVRLSSSLRRQIPVSLSEKAVVATLFLSCVSWFVSAPDVRFGGVFMWMFTAAVAIPFVAAKYSTEAAPRLILAAATLLSLVLTSNGWPHLKRAPDWQPVGEAGVRWTSFTDVVKIGNDRGPPLLVNVPRAGQSCGETALPCTPAVYVRTQKLRRPGDLGGGFMP